MTEAEILGALNLGTSKEVFEGVSNSPLAHLLDTLAHDVTDQLVKSLDKYDVNASYNLRQSIIPTEAVVDDKGVSVAIQADFYWKFVQYGVNGYMIQRGAPTWGKQPSTGVSWHESTVKWMADRGITPRNKGETIDQVAWAIMRAKVRDGQKARPFFTDVVNEKTIAYLRKPIEKLLKRSIEIRITEPWQ